MLGRNNDILLHVLSKQEVIFLNSVYEVIIILMLKPDIVSTEKMQTLSLMHTNKIFYKPIIFLIIKKYQTNPNQRTFYQISQNCLPILFKIVIKTKKSIRKCHSLEWPKEDITTNSNVVPGMKSWNRKRTLGKTN